MNSNKHCSKQLHISCLADTIILVLTYSDSCCFRLYFVCSTGWLQLYLFIGVTWKDTKIHTFLMCLSMFYTKWSGIVAENIPLAQETLNIAAMIDSGAAGNFMSVDFAHKNSIPLIRCLSPLAVEAVDGRPLGSGRITHLTSRLTLVTGALHQEIIQFYIISTLHAPVILGLPWLRKHDPSISWRDSQITGWGSTCFKHCLPQIHPLPLQAVEVTDPTPDIQGLPDAYHSLREAFSKSRKPPSCPLTDLRTAP